MSEDALQKKLQRMQYAIGVLESMIEEQTRETFVANQKLLAVSNFLQEIYKAMPGALLVFDERGAMETLNDAALSLLGYAEAELTGRSIAMIFEPGHAPDLAEIRDRAARGEVLRSEKVIRTRDGASIPVLFSATVLGGGGGGRAFRVVCVALDIRDRKKLELELRQAQKLESVGRLAAGVAHEINTPVQFVSDSMSFMKDAVNDMQTLLEKYQAVHRSVLAGAPSMEAAAEASEAEETCDLPYLVEHMPKALDRSLDGLGRVAAIVRSMKQFAHPDHSEMTSVDLNEAIRSTLTIARHEYKYVAEVVTDLGELPPVVCHGGDVNQAILNIIVNAAHAIGDLGEEGEQRGTITIRTRNQDDCAVVSISDTGGGIPESVRERIFEPFFTTKEVGRGTGQGLSIARSIILEKHGGTLTFETETGKGTTFVIRLPLDGGGSQATSARNQAA